MADSHTNFEMVEILLAEDSPADAHLTIEKLQESKFANRIHHVVDGQECLKFLKKETPFETAPRPDLLLLDLNMPKIDGRQVLEKIKADDELKDIPVVVLTTSEAEEDILRSYQLHANCYVSKPVELEEFSKIVVQLEQFWMAVVRLPTSKTTKAASK